MNEMQNAQQPTWGLAIPRADETCALGGST